LPRTNTDAIRLTRRLKKQNKLFTFLNKPEVDSNNNHAERQIRPAVMMTIFRTLKLRDQDATPVIVAGLGELLQSGSLPR